MEEYVGSKWHQWVTSKARLDYPDASVALSQCIGELALLHRAFGGDVTKRIGNSYGQKLHNRRTWLQKLAGTGGSWDLPFVDEDYLRVPDTAALLDDPVLNRLWYRWMVALGAFVELPIENIATSNQRAVAALLASYPGFVLDYERLRSAFLQLRPVPKRPEEIALEARVIQALYTDNDIIHLSNVELMQVYPVWMWFYPAPARSIKRRNNEDAAKQAGGEAVDKNKSKKTHQAEQVDDNDGRSGLMAFRLESMFSWMEYVPVDRTEDDNGDVDTAAADDLEKLALSSAATSAKRVRMELDIANAEDDDELVIEEQQILLPEWDYRSHQLKTDYCCLVYEPLNDVTEQPLPQKLRHSAMQLRRQFGSLLPQKQHIKRQPEGREIDLDAWLDFISQPVAADNPSLYEEHRYNHRDISCLLLADLSLSTESWIGEAGRVVDIIKDSMLLFAEALSGSGDRFAIAGFSSQKRHGIKWHSIKSFDQPYDGMVRGRVDGIEPGFYTRMGAAIRYATKKLEEQQTQHKILLLLTDGKPNDLDHYEGRYGIEDTRHSLMECRQQGIIPYCITIDQFAREYLPHIFGKGAYTLIQDPAQLPARLPSLYAQLTQV